MVSALTEEEERPCGTHPVDGNATLEGVDEGLKPQGSHTFRDHHMINGSFLAIKAPEEEMPSVMEIRLTVSEIKLALAPCAEGSTEDGRNTPL